jgi:hypothetical protein
LLGARCGLVGCGVAKAFPSELIPALSNFVQFFDFDRTDDCNGGSFMEVVNDMKEWAMVI